MAFQCTLSHRGLSGNEATDAFAKESTLEKISIKKVTYIQTNKGYPTKGRRDLNKRCTAERHNRICPECKKQKWRDRCRWLPGKILIPHNHPRLLPTLRYGLHPSVLSCFKIEDRLFEDLHFPLHLFYCFCIVSFFLYCICTAFFSTSFFSHFNLLILYLFFHCCHCVANDFVSKPLRCGTQ